MISLFKNYSVIHSTVNEQMQKYKPTAQEKYLAQGFSLFWGQRDRDMGKRLTLVAERKENKKASMEKEKPYLKSHPY